MADISKHKVLVAEDTESNFLLVSYILRGEYEISCPEIDWILKRLSEIRPNLDDPRNPTACGRITGKGFGRCIYTFISDDDIPAFKAKLAEYERIFGFHTACYEVSPADGAHVVTR